MYSRRSQPSAQEVHNYEGLNNLGLKYKSEIDYSRQDMRRVNNEYQQESRMTETYNSSDDYLEPTGRELPPLPGNDSLRDSRTEVVYQEIWQDARIA